MDQQKIGAFLKELRKEKIDRHIAIKYAKDT